MSPSSWLDQLNDVAPIFVDAALRGAVVLLLALVLTYTLRRRSAAARHLVWVGAIVVQLLLPLFAIWGPRWEVAVSSRLASVLPVDLPTTGVNARANSDGGSTTPAPTGGVSAPSIAGASGARHVTSVSSVTPSQTVTQEASDRAPISGRLVLLVLWILGAVVVLVRLAVGTSMVATLARKGARVDDGSWLSLAQKLSSTLQIDRPLTLLRGDKLGVPVTWGIVYPVVLLPDDADSWTEERRRFVLVHEMAHVKRLDALTQLAGQLALALFWFDPLVWIANRRMQLEREHACDDYVLRHGTAPSTYAEELLSMVRSLGTPDHRSAQPAFAALAMARRSEFEGRMLSILDPVLDRHPLSKGRTLMSAFAALLLVVPLAALHPYKSANASTTAKTTPRTMTVAVDAGTKKSATDYFPESFKISILPAQETDTAALAPRVLTKPLGTLAAGAGVLGTKLPAAGSELVTVSGKQPTCDTFHFTGSGSGTTTHIHSDDDGDGSAVIDLTTYNGERCSSATIVGRIKYTPNEDDIADMAFGSHAMFRQRTATDDRELTVSRGPDGTLQRAYRYNGRSADYDDNARRWFATYLPSVLMEAGINVKPRVAQWRAQGGVDNVLSRIATMTSSGAKRSHYEALLDGDKLTPDELERVMRSASENLRGSSGDMRAILTRAAPTARLSRQGVTAFERALVAMGSSGDKAAVLQIYGDTDDRDMLLAVMRASEGVSSSGDKTRLYQVIAPHYLAKGDRALVSSWFGHVEQIPSSGDLRNALMIAMPFAPGSTDVARSIIEAARSVSSSGDRSRILISMVSSGALTTKELRDAFFSAAAEIPSEGDRGRVLSAAVSMLKQ
ncbi:MAG: peptidase BlaR1 [Gemmatimonadetes bacterium]|nr:peptidase BlaR1 [Gemmatimonadota bacterium]